jgi:hypothetical protein
VLEFVLEIPRTTAPSPVKNPFDSLLGTVILGLALTAVLYYLVRSLVAA